MSGNFGELKGPMKHGVKSLKTDFTDGEEQASNGCVNLVITYTARGYLTSNLLEMFIKWSLFLPTKHFD